jgi:hypothetical protein
MKMCNGKSNVEIVKSYLKGDRPFIQVGYQPSVEKKHKDGDVWKDQDGKEWIQIGASKISKNLHDTKESSRRVCPVCKKDIFWGGNSYDEKFFNKTGKCYDCVVEEETKMRLEGTFEVYEKIKVIKNQKAFLEELKQKIDESITWINNKSNKIEYLNEDGTMDLWSDLSKETFLEDAEKDLKEVDKSLILCGESISMLEKQLNEIKSTKPTES